MTRLGLAPGFSLSPLLLPRDVHLPWNTSLLQAWSKALGPTPDGACEATLPDAPVFFSMSHCSQQRAGPACIVCLHCHWGCKLQAPLRLAQELAVTLSCMATIQRRPVRCEYHLMRCRHSLPRTEEPRVSRETRQAGRLAFSVAWGLKQRPHPSVLLPCPRALVHHRFAPLPCEGKHELAGVSPAGLWRRADL